MRLNQIARPLCRWTRSLVVLGLCLTLAACGLWPEKDPDELPENWPED
ncbi:MAG: hypothetical protein RL434_1721, partial [Pseudomonadota bacterium]